MTTTVVDIRAGEAFDVYAGRNFAGKVPKTPGEYGWLGNPFKTAEAFEEYFLARVHIDLRYRKEVLAVRGKRLG